MEDINKEFLAKNIEGYDEFKKNINEEKKNADEWYCDKIVIHKVEEMGYKVIQHIEQKPVKSAIISLLALVGLKKVVNYLKK
jgi:hypothetical protein